MDWLDSISQEAAAEASEEEPAVEVDDFLASLPQTDDLPQIEIQEPVEQTPTPVEEDDGMAWLESLAAKQGIAEEELVTSPEDRSEEPPAWLDQTSEEPQPEQVDQLAPEPATEEPAPAEEESMDWLDAISQEAAAEASEGEPAAEADDLLASLPQTDDLPTIETQEPVEQTHTPVEEDDGMAWLEGLAAKQGIAEEELVTSPEDRGEEPPDWLDQTSEESLDWLESPNQEAAAEASQGEETVKTDDWLESLGELEEDSQVEPDPASSPERSVEIDEILRTLTDSKEDDITDLERVVPVTGELKEEHLNKTVVDEPIETEDDVSLVPEWIQDVAEQKTEPDAIQEPPEWLPSLQEPTEKTDGVTPTRSEEWLPESDADAATPPAPKPVITPKPAPPEASEALEAARQAVRANNLEEALNIYTNLIKRGKMIEQVIEELQEALRKHPVDVALWQALGDAYMRNDSLQEALDSYSKAEDLLR